MAIKEKITQILEEHVIDEKLEDIVGDRFGSYSKYIIQERALPDVRDGLKPVQRRILYSMYKLGMFSTAPFRKSARITGDVMGKYHPHGDSSIYEAMVRMSQYWKMRITLITMHGNNGSMDGDSAAAMRYTEARLSKNAEYMLQDIDKKTVLFTPNFDDEELEPTVLPAKFPNLLVNGATGISAGYATDIPPHNLEEVINTAIYKIDHPNMTIDDLLKIMKGPDFPTGGIVQGQNHIRDYFEKGKGRFIIRSKTSFEEISKEQQRIVVTEIPYEVNKAELVKKMEQMRIDGKIDGILEVRDESDREGLRIAIDLKKQVNTEAILNFLFKNTDLQISYSANMIAIHNHRPVVMGVLDIIDAYINHQKEVMTNRCNYELQKAQRRLHIVSGLMKMVSIVDEIIKTIKASKNKSDSKERIIEKYGFSEIQAEAIVTLQLYRLSNTDILELQEENRQLEEKIAALNIILGEEKELLKEIKKELRDIIKNIPCERKTVIEDEIADIKVDDKDLISEEQTMISITKDGYVKRSNLRSVQQSKTNTIKEQDSVLLCKEVSTLDTLLLFTSMGYYIYYPIYKMQESKWGTVGTYIGNVVTLDAGKDTIINAFIIRDFEQKLNLLLTSKKGLMKQTPLQDFILQRYTKAGRAMKLNKDDELVSVDITNHPLEVIAITKNSECLRFRADEVSLYGTSAGGIKAINMKPTDCLVSAFYANKNDDIVCVTSRGNIKRSKVQELPISRRSRSGTALIKMIKANPHFIVSAVKMTPNQYSEDVEVNILHELGNFYFNSFSIKYTDSNTGRLITDSENLVNISKIILSEPKNPDKIENGEYLLVDTESLFAGSKELEAKEEKSKSILDDLEAILAKENPNNKSTKDKKYNQLSIFDEE